MKLSKEEKRRLRKEKKAGFFGEFKKFITRGNIVDMSVGVIVGGAFTAIVNGLSNNILKPIINWFLTKILGKNSLSDIYTYLQKVEVAEVDAEGNATGKMVVDLTQSIYIDWGAFINAIINFLIIAFVLFIIVKFINQLNNKEMHEKYLGERIEWKQERKIRLNKKEKAYLAKLEANKKAQEEKAIADALAAEAQKALDEKAAQKEQIQAETLEVLKELKGMLSKNA